MLDHSSTYPFAWNSSKRPRRWQTLNVRLMCSKQRRRSRLYHRQRSEWALDWLSARGERTRQQLEFRIATFGNASTLKLAFAGKCKHTKTVGMNAETEAWWGLSVAHYHWVTVSLCWCYPIRKRTLIYRRAFCWALVQLRTEVSLSQCTKSEMLERCSRCRCAKSE